MGVCRKQSAERSAERPSVQLNFSSWLASLRVFVWGGSHMLASLVAPDMCHGDVACGMSHVYVLYYVATVVSCYYTCDTIYARTSQAKLRTVASK